MRHRKCFEFAGRGRLSQYQSIKGIADDRFFCAKANAGPGEHPMFTRAFRIWGGVFGGPDVVQEK